jgi:hypothetical protein
MNIPDKIVAKNVASGNVLPVADVPEDFAKRIRRDNAVDQALFERWSETKWSGKPRDVDVDLPTGDQLSYISNEISRQVMNRAIKIIRPRL